MHMFSIIVSHTENDGNSSPPLIVGLCPGHDWSKGILAD